MTVVFIIHVFKNTHDNVVFISFEAGYSFGGMVAYEMASELIRNSETVAMVFMVDTYPWFPKALTNCSEFITKCAELNLKILETDVVNIHAVANVLLCILPSDCAIFYCSYKR